MKALIFLLGAHILRFWVRQFFPKKTSCSRELKRYEIWGNIGTRCFEILFLVFYNFLLFV